MIRRIRILLLAALCFAASSPPIEPAPIVYTYEEAEARAKLPGAVIECFVRALFPFPETGSKLPLVELRGGK